MIDTLQRTKRFFKIFISLFAVLVVSYSSMFIQRYQHAIGFGIDRTVVFLIINAQIIIIGVLLYLVIRNACKLILEHWSGAPGTAFKMRLILSFGVLAVAPALFVFFTAGNFIIKSIDSWFDVRFDKALDAAVSIGRPLLKAPVDNVLAVLDQTHDLHDAINRVMRLEQKDLFCYAVPHAEPLKKYLTQETAYWRSIRTVNDRTTKKLFALLKKEIEQRSHKIFDFYGSTYIVHDFHDAGLIIALRYPPQLRQHITALQEVYYDYRALRAMRGPIFFSYFSVYLLLLVLILFLALWLSFYLAKSLMAPMQGLLAATDAIEKGQYPRPLDVEEAGDFAHLVISFNKMVTALETAQKNLMQHNQQLQHILQHLSAGVIVLNKWGRVGFINNAAQTIARDLQLSCLQGAKIHLHYLHHDYTKIYTNIRTFLRSADSINQTEFEFIQGDSKKTYILFMSYCNDFSSTAAGPSLLIMFEDVTEVVQNTTFKAWQHVVKQLAHEIKNPLTPMLLAAQRLKRNVSVHNEKNKLFVSLLDTIIDQVFVIKQLTDQFGQFGSISKASITPHNLYELLSSIVQIYRLSYTDVTFTLECLSHLYVAVDAQKLRQVLVNLFDNSIQALQSSQNKKITIACIEQDTFIEIIFTDSGPGVALAVRQALFLPYVSSHKKNMGLGLAIARTMLESMNGTIQLLDSLDGARFKITILKHVFNLQYEKKDQKKFDFF